MQRIEENQCIVTLITLIFTEYIQFLKEIRIHIKNNLRQQVVLWKCATRWLQRKLLVWENSDKNSV